jgi:AraC-like DNA-binding protein
MRISIVFARILVAEVWRRGFDGNALLARCDIAAERLDDWREMLSFEETAQLVEHTLALTADPAIGLTAGSSAPEHALQLLGQLVLAQPTIAGAVETLTRYGELLVEGTSWSLSEHGDDAILACGSILPECEVTQVIFDLQLALTINIGRHFFPVGERLRGVYLRRPRPSHIAHYHQVFQCPVQFHRAGNALVFDKALIHRRQIHTDSVLAVLLREAADKLLKERSAARRLTDLVEAMLRAEGDLTRVDMRSIARSLHLSVHGLRRRLNAEGTSFSTLLDQARAHVARQQLRQRDVTIEQASALLGFSEATAFFRAFKRWTGQTPTEFRRTSTSSSVSSAGMPA